MSRYSFVAYSRVGAQPGRHVLLVRSTRSVTHYFPARFDGFKGSARISVGERSTGQTMRRFFLRRRPDRRVSSDILLTRPGSSLQYRIDDDFGCAYRLLEYGVLAISILQKEKVFVWVNRAVRYLLSKADAFENSLANYLRKAAITRMWTRYVIQLAAL